MDKVLARELAVNAIKAASLLNSLNLRIKSECAESEYEELIKIIATISADIGIELLERVFKEHPDLEKDIGDQISKTGKAT